MNDFKILFKQITNFRFADSFLHAHQFPLHNEPISMPACRLKTVGGVGFEVDGNVNFQERGLYKHVL